MSLPDHLTITKTAVWPVDIPLTDDFVISQGRLTTVENAFVSVTLSGGATGYGEIAPFEALTGERRDESLATARGLVGDVEGRDASEHLAISDWLHESAPDAPAARTGVECAVVDAYARALRTPLWELWGAAAVQPYETDITLPILSDERTLELASHWYDAGFRTFKLKVGADVEADLRRIRRIADAHEDVRFILDANQGFNETGAYEFVSALGGLTSRVVLFEQPVPRDDVAGMASLRDRTSVTIAADESVFTLADARRVIDAKAADVINLKIMKSGLLQTIRIAELARAHGIGLMIGGMVESRLAMSFSLCIAQGFGGITHFDLDTPLLLASDPLDGGFAYNGPLMSVCREPGVGAHPRVL